MHKVDLQNIGNVETNMNNFLDDVSITEEFTDVAFEQVFPSAGEEESINDLRHNLPEIVSYTEPNEGYQGDSDSEEYWTPDECDEDSVFNSIIDSGSRESRDIMSSPARNYEQEQAFSNSQGSLSDCSSNLLLPRRMTSVSWSSEIVTEIRFRPSITEDEKEIFYHSPEDMLRFRREYKIFQKLHRGRLEDECVDLPFPSSRQDSPLSGLINMATKYMTRLSVGGNGNSPPRSTVAQHVSKRNYAEMSTLVDTLYLF